MDVFLARQPIFDARQVVVAYELLFRNGPENFFPNVDGSQASASLVHSTLEVFGLETLADGKKLFVNVTAHVLKQDWLRMLPPDRTVIEILETVEPDDEIVAACRTLKDSGYSIALDDFVFRPGYQALVDLADIIKVDFIQTRGDERSAVIGAHGRAKLGFLAEKVESAEEMADAKARGYKLFQGYFFCRPEMMAARDIPPFKHNYLRLLALANEEPLDLARLEEVIKQDMALSVKLLRYLNSAGFGLAQTITSIRHALVLLGESSFRRWLSLAAMAGLGGDKPQELVAQAMARARFCELLGPQIGDGRDEPELFLIGMLSLVDVLLGRPMSETLARLSVSERVRKALLERTGTAGQVLDLVLAYERAEWAGVSAATRALRIGDEERVAAAYGEALSWVARVFRADGAR